MSYATYATLATVMKQEPRIKNTAFVRDHFDELVLNAIDFLDRSVLELLNGDIKYSSLHFCQALELFVKARLFVEHWSLIIADPSKADRAKFEKGDFISVSLPQAIERLALIAGDDISSIQRTFEPIRKRRNRLIHFHAPEVPKKPEKGHVARRDDLDLLTNIPREIGDLVAEQCLAWFELHTLLSTRWKSHFPSYRDKVDYLNRRMLEVRPYLKTRFERLGDEIVKLKKAGKVTECVACGFLSNQDSEVFWGMVQSRCIVCQRIDRCFHFQCPEADCEGEILVTESNGGTCDECGLEMSPLDIAKEFQKPYYPQDGGEPSWAYCHVCEASNSGRGTVEWVEQAGKFVCFNCLEDFDSISSCERCGERITGPSKDTYITGCAQCDSWSAFEKDDG